MLSRAIRMPLLLVVLCALAFSVRAQGLTPPKPATPYLSLRYDTTGQTVEEARKEAHLRAIRNAVGRLYFTDYMLRARTLLTPYLAAHHNDFIARETIFENRLQGGQRFLDIEVVVDCEKLWADLFEKRFVYRPALRPLFYVFMSETFDGAEMVDHSARTHLLELMNGKDLATRFDKLPYRYLWADPPLRADDPAIPVSDKTEVVLANPSPYKDPSVSAEALAEACREAQRNEVEVFIAATVETKTTEKTDVYFESYTYVETFCSLKLVRSDTHEILAVAETRVSAAHPDADQARRVAAASALSKIAPEIFTAFQSVWDKTVLRKAKIRVMTVGKDGVADLATVRELVKAAVPEATVYTRAAFANIGVMNVDWSGGEIADLIRRLQLSNHPQYNIVFVAPDSLILEIL